MTTTKTHPEKDLLVRIAFYIDTFQTDNANFLKLIGVRVDVEVRPENGVIDQYGKRNRRTPPPQNKPPFLPYVLACVSKNHQMTLLCGTTGITGNGISKLVALLQN
jgi:hypothetical protein